MLSYNGHSVTVEGDGLDKIEQLADDRNKRIFVLKQLLEHWASYADARQRAHAPSGETGYLHAHLGKSGTRYEPGGAGGGGGYARIIGVRRGSSDHPLYVHFGTANPEGQTYRGMLVGGTGEKQGRIYPRGDRAAASIYAPGEAGHGRKRRRRPGTDQDPYVAAQRNPALTFQKRGEPRRFRAWVSGQKPQPFVYFAYINTVVYMRPQLRAAARALGI